VYAVGYTIVLLVLVQSEVSAGMLCTFAQDQMSVVWFGVFFTLVMRRVISLRTNKKRIG
jgi:hypothetical protein